MTDIVLDEGAVKVALKLIKMREGCVLHAYPDPDSELSKQLSKHNLLRAFMQGKVEIPNYMIKEFDGKPFTIGYGETQGVKLGDVWTQERADEQVDKRVRGVMEGAIRACPQLAKESRAKVAACTSLAYNIGLAAFAGSTVCKATQAKDYEHAANAFLLWNKDKINGVFTVVDGLTKRRQIEKDLYMSVSV